MNFRIFAGPFRIAMLYIAAAFSVSPALAQDSYPTRPITLIVPQAPGGTNDIVGRLIGQKLSEVLPGSLVVENRAGAGGVIGTQLAARARKDGYTLLMTISSSQAINPALYKNVGFDPIEDFEPIGLVGSVPNVLLVNPSFPAQNLKELLAAAHKGDPNLQFASAGNGTLNHLLGEMLNSMAGIKLDHVPYKGVGPAINDVIGGQLPIVFASMPSALPQIKAGKLRAIAVSSERRSPALPDVPAIAEEVPGYNGTLWIGLFAPSGIPADVTLKLQDGMRKALTAEDLRAQLEQQGVEIAPQTTPEQFSQLLKDDLIKWAHIVKTSGASVN